jgi:hypothetical protein
MLVAVAYFGLQNVQRVRDAHGRLLGKLAVDPIFDARGGFDRVALFSDDCPGQRANLRVIALDKRRGLKIGGVSLSVCRNFVRADAGEFLALDFQNIPIEPLAAAVERKIIEDETGKS